MPWMDRRVASYLERMGLFSRCRPESVLSQNFQRHDRRGSLVELTKLTSLDESDSTAAKVATAISGTMVHHDPAAPVDEHLGLNEFGLYKYPIQYALTELFDNSLTHARKGASDAAVWVAAQYYPTKDAVQVAVVDNGCGMLATLVGHKALQQLTHEAAINAALIPRVSCNRGLGVDPDCENQGVGLTTTYGIVRAAGGTMAIVSGGGFHIQGSDSGRLPFRGYWQGVAISFTLRRSMLPKVRVSEQLPSISAPPVRVRFDA